MAGGTVVADDLARLRQLLNQGIDPDKIARSAALAAAIDAVLADKKLGDLTPQEIAALIEKGLAYKPVVADDSGEAITFVFLGRRSIGGLRSGTDLRLSD